MDRSLIARKVSCSRILAGSPAQVLDLSATFEPATVNILFGPDDCGKNLLLRLLSLMERPDSGEVLLHGESTRDWPDEQLTDIRSRHFGFVFEAPYLLPSFSVQENIAMPLFKLTGASPEQVRGELERMLHFVGLPDCAEASTLALPLGWQLRVALARALITEPVALFVENLDTLLRDDELIEFLTLLAKVPATFGSTVFITALSRDLAAYGNRALAMAGGRIIADRTV